MGKRIKGTIKVPKVQRKLHPCVKIRTLRFYKNQQFSRLMIVKIYLYLYEKWHNVKIFLLKISGKAHGATGDVACDGYHKFKVCMP